MFGKNFEKINTKRNIKIIKNDFYKILNIVNTLDFSYFKLFINKNFFININERNFYLYLSNGSIELLNTSKKKENSYFAIKDKISFKTVTNIECFIFFQHNKKKINITRSNNLKISKLRVCKFKSSLKKYWGEIHTLFSNKKGACKIIVMRSFTQSSMEFHIYKKENYFINNGILNLGIRYGKAEQKIIQLKKNDSFFMNVGIMHIRMTKKGTEIIEMSNKDSDYDSNIVHNGETYNFSLKDI